MEWGSYTGPQPLSEVGQIISLLSASYMRNARPICRRLLVQAAAFADLRAFERAGVSIAANIDMIAITTSNSIKVKLKLIV